MSGLRIAENQWIDTIDTSGGDVRQSFIAMGTCGQAEHYMTVGSELEEVDPDALHRCASIIFMILVFKSAIK